MVAGGTEAAVSEVAVGGFAALTALSGSDDPKRASIPFDKERDGFVIGEGSGIVVLESLEHAQAARAMVFAMDEAGITPDKVDYINAHGTSTHANDLFETKAIKKALGEHAYDVKISSTKSMIGHGLGAAGAIEFITCVKSIEEDYIHPTVGLKVPDEECDLDYTLEPVTDRKVNYVMSNSLGFGGHNATLLVKKFED